MNVKGIPTKPGELEHNRQVESHCYLLNSPKYNRLLNITKTIKAFKDNPKNPPRFFLQPVN